MILHHKRNNQFLKITPNSVSNARLTYGLNLKKIRYSVIRHLIILEIITVCIFMWYGPKSEIISIVKGLSYKLIF